MFPSDFHVSGLPVLLAVAEAPASQRELSDGLGLNRTLMVQIVDRLEAGGLVARRRDAPDNGFLLARTDVWLRRSPRSCTHCASVCSAPSRGRTSAT